MWDIIALLVMAAAFAWLAYQLYRGGKSNEALLKSNASLQLKCDRLSNKCDELGTKLDQASEENEHLSADLAKTRVALQSCQTAIENQ